MQVHRQANNSPPAFTLPPTVTLESASSSPKGMMTMHKRRNTIPHWAAPKAVGLWGLWRIMATVGDNDPLQEFWRNASTSPNFPPSLSTVTLSTANDTFTQAQCLQLVTFPAGAKRI